MNEIFRIILDTIIYIILTIIVFIGIVLFTPVVALVMIVLMFIGLYEIVIWIINEIKNT